MKYRYVITGVEQWLNGMVIPVHSEEGAFIGQATLLLTTEYDHFRIQAHIELNQSLPAQEVHKLVESGCLRSFELNAKFAKLSEETEFIPTMSDLKGET